MEFEEYDLETYLRIRIATAERKTDALNATLETYLRIRIATAAYRPLDIAKHGSKLTCAYELQLQNS